MKSFAARTLAHNYKVRKGWKSSVQIALLGITTAYSLSLTLPAEAADLEAFSFTAAKTGTAPFEANNDPGNDQDDTNDIVRTYDTITYQWDYTANNGDATNTVLSATLSADQAWEAVPAACLSPGSGIQVNPNGTQTLSCNIETVTNASTGFIKATARVLAQRPDSSYVGNGDILSAIGSITSTSVTFDPSLHEMTDPTTVSATPKSDLRKNAAYVVGQYVGRDGSTPGVVVRYPINVIIGGGKGSEPLDGDIVVNDTIAFAPDPNVPTVTIPVPGAEIYDWSTDNPGCGWMGQYPRSYYGSRPYGQYDPNVVDHSSAANVPSNSTNSVINSGDWTCTQADPSEPIELKITGANTSGTTTPTLSYNNRTIPATEKYLISGTMEIWIPVQTINDNGGELLLSNTLDPLTTPGVSGQPNQEPTLVNNGKTFTLLAGRGSFNQYYAKFGARGTVLAPMAALNAGDGVVMPTQDFSKRLLGTNNGILPWEDFRYCEKFNNQAVVLKPLATDPSTAIKVFNAGTYGYEIEYGTGDENGDPGTYSSDDAMRLATCEDEDSVNDTWYTDITQVPDIDSITKIRFVATEDMPPNANMDLQVDFTARNYYPGTTDKIPVGTLLPNFSAYSTPTITASQDNDAEAHDGWYVGSYNPVNHAGTKAFGDRLRLTRAIVRVEKTRIPDNNDTTATVSSFNDGNLINYSLRPTVNATIDPAPLSPTLTLRDTLPAELSYVSGSASLPPTSVTSQPDGTTILEWNLGQRVPNQPVDPVTFTAQVRPEVLDGIDAINTVLVESPDDGSDDSERTALHTVTIGNSASYGIGKETVTEIINPDEPMIFRLVYANTGPNDVASATFIDILPYRGDNRTPLTTYAGDLFYESITGTNGETFEFTNAIQSDISPDPNDSSNQPGSLITQWCPEIDFGNVSGCPLDKGDVTAIKIVTPLFISGDPSRQLFLTLNTQDNTQGDIYTNVFTGRADGFLGLLESDAVPVQVVIPPDVLLVKRITAINGNRTQNPNDGTLLNQVIDDTTSSYAANDSHPNWPANYLLGAIDGGNVAPNDEIEYTVYFHNVGGSDAAGVILCDLIQPNQSFLWNAYGTNADIQQQLQSGSTMNLTALNDGIDRGEFISSGSPIPSDCNTSSSNTSGVVKVDVTGTSGLPVLSILPGSEAINTPSPAYGWIRFNTKVD